MNKKHPVPLSLLVLSVSVVATACGRVESKVSPEGASPVAVATAPVAMADVPTGFEAGGIVRARFVAAISSRVLAPVAAVRVRPGDRVRAGQPLVNLDARQPDADVRRTAAALVAAEKGARAAEADTRGAEASLAAARATRDRIVSLFDRRSATAQERDDAEAAFGAADARAAGTQARAAEATAVVEAARAAADAASIAASYAVVSAPFDGTVSERHVDPGDMAAPGTPLLTIENTDALQLEVRLDEARGSAIFAGYPVQIRFDPAGGSGEAAATPISARVTEIGRLDPASHSFLVKIDLPGAERLRPGTFGRAVFEGPVRRALVIPASAVLRRGQLVFVFTVADGVARLRPVTIGPPSLALPATGASFGGLAPTVEVTAGLSEGEAVVIDVPESLLDGAKVTAAAVGARR